MKKAGDIVQLVEMCEHTARQIDKGYCFHGHPSVVRRFAYGRYLLSNLVEKHKFGKYVKAFDAEQIGGG